MREYENEGIKLIKGTCIVVRVRVDKCDVTFAIVLQTCHCCKKGSLENRLGNWSINNLIDQWHECRITLIGSKNETSFQGRLSLILNS